jgi:hypothetical protein
MALALLHPALALMLLALLTSLILLSLFDAQCYFNLSLNVPLLEPQK